MRNRKDGKSQKLTILTFNYDRSLEYYLFEAFRATLHLSVAQAKTILSEIEIIHLHGSIGRLPWQDGGESAYDYATEFNFLKIDTCAGGIRIIHENDEQDAGFVRAREVLGTADRVMFLGFGYNPTNIRRLIFDGWLARREAFKIAGSIMGPTPQEAEGIKSLLWEKLWFPKFGGDCLETLRHAPSYLN